MAPLIQGPCAGACVPQLPAFSPVGLGDAQGRAWVGHALQASGYGPLEPSTDHPGACCPSACSFRVAMSSRHYPVSWSHLGMQTGPPGSPSPPLALFVRDGQEVPSAIQVHQGPGRGRGPGQRPWVKGHNPPWPWPPGTFLGDEDWLWGGCGLSGLIWLGMSEGTSIGQPPTMPALAPHPEDGILPLSQFGWAQRGTMSCPGSPSKVVCQNRDLVTWEGPDCPGPRLGDAHL